MRIKDKIIKVIKEYYGTGSGINLPFALVFSGIVTLFGMILCYFLFEKKHEVEVLRPIEVIPLMWLGVFLISAGVFCMGVFFYFRTVKGKDRCKYIKISFFVISLLGIGVVLSPIILLLIFIYMLLNKLSLRKLGERTFDSVVSLLWWIMSIVSSFVLFLIMGQLLKGLLGGFCGFIVTGVDNGTIIYFSTFFSILVSNKVGMTVFFKTTRIEDESSKKAIRSEMVLLWNYLIFILSFLLKPLEFNNDFLSDLVDAIWYSSATISLFSKIVAEKGKLKGDDKRDEFLCIEGAGGENKIEEGDKCRGQYWDYYVSLEKEFEEIFEYVDIRISNFATSSNKLNGLLLRVGTEADFMFKLVCGFDLDSKKNMFDYVNVLRKKIPDIQKVEVVAFDFEVFLHPFEGWSKKNADKLAWWNAYMSIKENRAGNVEKGNLINLLNAMAALYFLEMCYINRFEVTDIKASYSGLFYLADYSAGNIDVDKRTKN